LIVAITWVWTDRILIFWLFHCRELLFSFHFLFLQYSMRYIAYHTINFLFLYRCSFIILYGFPASSFKSSKDMKWYRVVYIVFEYLEYFLGLLSSKYIIAGFAFICANFKMQETCNWKEPKVYWCNLFSLLINHQRQQFAKPCKDFSTRNFVSYEFCKLKQTEDDIDSFIEKLGRSLHPFCA